ncbi:MAG: hypothetical protein AVDCRST_MAG88-1899, partial [uncultured Thermomicrobiales bacterium]
MGTLPDGVSRCIAPLPLLGARTLPGRAAKRATRELGLLTVAEGVERQAEFTWLHEQGVDFVQGYPFARPAAPPLLGGVVLTLAAGWRRPHSISMERGKSTRHCLPGRV